MYINTFQVLSKVFSNIITVFPRGPKRGNPTATTGTVTARITRDPQHYVEGKKEGMYEEHFSKKQDKLVHIKINIFIYYAKL